MPTLLQSLYQAQLIPAPIASYRISRLADNKNDGELTLGALDPKYYDPSTLVTKPNVNKFGYWGVDVDAVQVGEKNMQWPNRTIVVDTGTVRGLFWEYVGIFILMLLLADTYYCTKSRKFSVITQPLFLLSTESL